MRKNVLACVLAAGCIAGMLTGCGSRKKDRVLQDGTYTAKSEIRKDILSDDGENSEEDDAAAGYGVVTISVKDGKIADCDFKTYTVDGQLKDKEYGKKQGGVANRDFYNKAQKAVAAVPKYAEMLVENGQLDGIDAISGATINYEEFSEAVDRALDMSEKGQQSVKAETES